MPKDAGHSTTRISVALDADVVRLIDRESEKRSTSRSALLRELIESALEIHALPSDSKDIEKGTRHFVDSWPRSRETEDVKKTLAKKIDAHRRGYARFPLTNDELSFWESEQVWGDE